MNIYTGIREIKIKSETIDELYTNKKLSLKPEERTIDKRLKFQIQNEYLIIKDIGESNQSAIGRVYKEDIILVTNNIQASGIRPRNKEQLMAMNALLDDRVKVVVLTGSAGVGKTICCLGAAIHRAENNSAMYNKIILTRPMSWVGRHGLGALPGGVEEKFGPYLENYMCNLECIIGGNKNSVTDLISQLNMEFIPLQLIRGASWAKSFIIADEVQILTPEEMVALGTRVGEDSKIIIMGDLNQRDEKIEKEKTGIWKLIHSEIAQKSPLVATIELKICERSPTAELFANVFEV